MDPSSAAAAGAPRAAANAAANANAQENDVTRERISFNPHPKTLTMAGDYEYFAAQGQTPFAFALAELVDNSLRATKANRDRPRAIAVSLCVDAAGKKGMVCVRDNGRGMTARELNDWAVMNLSIEDRAVRDAAAAGAGGAEDGGGAAAGAGGAMAAANPAAASAAAAADDPATNKQQPHGRYLSGDISFFGVGSKNAAFYLGRTVKVATRAAAGANHAAASAGTAATTAPSAGRVSELCIRGDELERRYRAGEAVYEEDMVHRPAGVVAAGAHEDDHDRAFEAVMRPWLEAETAPAAPLLAVGRPASAGVGGAGGGNSSTSPPPPPDAAEAEAAAAASAAASAGLTFTRVMITDLKEDVLAQLLGQGSGGGGHGGGGSGSASPPGGGAADAHDLGADITRDLAHLYHYYLHGAGGNTFT
jgi:structural maintenance of chromosomes flexible hinge domain-containing protein 1